MEGGDGRRWTKTMTAAAIAAAMAEEATGLWRLRQLHGGNRAEANSCGDKAETSALKAVGQVKVLFTPIVPLGVLCVAEQYYLANSGDILASFLASVYTNKLFLEQIHKGLLVFSTSTKPMHK